MSTPTALCFGEMLWDFLPDGLFVGGAPLNVGYHLNALGVTAQVVSAVGTDFLGDELMRRVELWRLPTGGITRHAHLPTGTVRADISPAGDATYDIVTGVAWDEIVLTPEVLAAAGQCRALIFGSLAQRSATNQAALATLLAAVPANALRVFDVNLRSPHYDLDAVRTLARHANLLKLNLEEAGRWMDLPGAPGHERHLAEDIAKESQCPLVAITAGARGAGILNNGEWRWEFARPVNVFDTVGAGDAFLAALVANLLTGRRPVPDCLARACRVGEWVATQRGATPSYARTPAPGVYTP